MDTKSKLCSIFAYFSWLGWFICFFIGGRSNSFTKRHMNQALALNAAASIGGILTRSGGVIGVIGDIVALGVFVLAIMGIVRAARSSEEPLPLVGGINWIV